MASIRTMSCSLLSSLLCKSSVAAGTLVRLSVACLPMRRLATVFDGSADASGGEVGSSGSEGSGPSGQGLLLLIPLMLGLNGKVRGPLP